MRDFRVTWRKDWFRKFVLHWVVIFLQNEFMRRNFIHIYSRPITKHTRRTSALIFSRANICPCRNYGIQSWWYRSHEFSCESLTCGNDVKETWNFITFSLTYRTRYCNRKGFRIIIVNTCVRRTRVIGDYSAITVSESKSNRTCIQRLFFS
jgi:hypothetical protein